MLGKSKISKYAGLGSPIIQASPKSQRLSWRSKGRVSYMWSLERDLDMDGTGTWDKRKPITETIRPDRPQPDMQTMVVYGD